MTDRRDDVGTGSLVGEWDPEARLFRIRSWTPGPAGMASLERDGVHLEVDFAASSVLGEVVVEVPSGGDGRRIADASRRLLTDVFGDDLVAALLRLAATGASPGPVRIGPAASSAWRDLYAGLAVAREVWQTEAVSPLAAGLGALESAAMATRLDPGRAPSSIAAEDAGRAAELLEEALASGFDLGPNRETVLHDLLGIRGVLRQGLADDLGRRVDALVDALAGRAPSGAHLDTPTALAFEVSAPPASAPAAAAGVRAKKVARSAGRLEPEAAPTFVAVEDADGEPVAGSADRIGGEVRVTVDRSTAAAWVRAFRRSDRLLLAMAPLRPGRAGKGESLLVVPPGVPTDDLVVDVTVTPETPRPSDQRIAVRQAMATARQACRSERFDRMDDAGHLWSIAAERWATAGDRDRANGAERYRQEAIGGDRWEQERRGTDPRRDRRGPSDQGAGRSRPFLGERFDDPSRR